MQLIQLKNISVSFGDHALLENVDFSISSKERIALVGRNGTGKSTLLKLLGQEIQPDEGEIIKRDGLIISKLIQEIPNDLGGDVRSVIAMGDDKCGKLLSQYYLKDKTSEDSFLEGEITRLDGWVIDQRIKILVSKFNLKADEDFTRLSGGLKRRVLLAQSLLNEPDLLLLDEPTNHLDIATIEWMEAMLLNLNTTLLIVSHDRTFINKLASRIIDLDRGVLTSWPGNFDQYLFSKLKLVEDEHQQQKAFDKKLAQEEVWIRKGIQARRTRNEGRVRALKKMRQHRSQRRSQQQSASFTLNTAAQSGQLVVEAIEVNYSHGDDNTIIKDFSSTILRGDKIGIIGPNGCGKSTLIQLLTGDLKPDSGSIKMGTRLEVAYLNQSRSDIRENQSLLDNISQGRSEIIVNKKPMHIMTYLQEFLFPPHRAQVPASALSGGERNRLMLAKLFANPFNLLILDEPTNDLDIDTLELLEQKLVDYSGTLLLASHDRTFLNNIVTSTIVFEGEARLKEYIGGYDDWLRQNTSQQQAPKTATVKAKTNTTNSKPRKLSYKENKELKDLPLKIEAYETELSQIQEKLSDPDFYKQDNSKVIVVTERLKTIQSELELAYDRWQELENI